MFSRAAIEALRALPFMPGEDCLVRRQGMDCLPRAGMLNRGGLLQPSSRAHPGLTLVWGCSCRPAQSTALCCKVLC